MKFYKFAAILVAQLSTSPAFGQVRGNSGGGKGISAEEEDSGGVINIDENGNGGGNGTNNQEEDSGGVINFNENGNDGGNGAEKLTFIITLTDEDDSDGGSSTPGRGGGPANRCDVLAKAHGGSVGRVYERVLNGCTIELPQKAAAALARNPNVKVSEMNEEVHATQSFSQFVRHPRWGLDRMDQCSIPLDGEPYQKLDADGVRMYILDTGIEKNHPEVRRSIFSDSACHFSAFNYDASPDQDDPCSCGDELSDDPLDDQNGHGTHVAGIACGKSFGVASECDLCAIKVLDGNGNGSRAGVIAGIEHIVTDCASYLQLNPEGKCVANMSLGSSGDDSTTMNHVVEAAVDAGVVFVVAAGNDNADACGFWPGNVEKAITVGATVHNDTRWEDSNYGSCVDVYAPGKDIQSAVRGGATATWSGTSMASPYVAGLAAGIWKANPCFTAEEVRARIHDYAAIVGTDALGHDIRIANSVDNCNDSASPSPSCPPQDPLPIVTFGNHQWVDFVDNLEPDNGSLTFHLTAYDHSFIALGSSNYGYAFGYSPYGYSYDPLYHYEIRLGKYGSTVGIWKLRQVGSWPFYTTERYFQQLAAGPGVNLSFGTSTKFQIRWDYNVVSVYTWIVSYQPPSSPWGSPQYVGRWHFIMQIYRAQNRSQINRAVVKTLYRGEWQHVM